MSVLTTSDSSLRSLTHIDKLFKALTPDTAEAFTAIINSTTGDPLGRLALAAISRLNEKTVDQYFDKAENHEFLTLTLADFNLREAASEKKIEKMLRLNNDTDIQRIFITAISLYLIQATS